VIQAGLVRRQRDSFTPIPPSDSVHRFSRRGLRSLTVHFSHYVQMRVKHENCCETRKRGRNGKNL